MGDHKEVFRSLRELFPQVDQRILKAIAIEHRIDVDSAVVAVLDEVMPSMTGSAGVSSTHHEVVPPMADSVTNIFTNQSTRQVGSSSSTGHDMRVNEVNGSFHSAQHTSSAEVNGTQENVDSELYVGRLASIQGMNEVKEQLNLPPCPIPNGNQYDLISDLDARYSSRSSERKLANSDKEVGHGEYISSECFSQSRTGEMGGDNITIKAPQLHEQDSNNIIPAGHSSPQNNLLKFFSGYSDINDSFASFVLALDSDNQVSSGILSADKGAFAPVVNDPCPDTKGSSVGTSGVVVQKNTNNSGTGYDKQPSVDVTENGDILSSSETDMLPDLNLNHFSSTASTHSSHSVSIESLEDSIVDARSNKNDLLPSLELVTKMIEDVELLEEKAKVAKHESSVAGTSILIKVEELKDMLTHAKEANDMHAGEVFGEKSILTTEAHELQSRLQRLSDERNRYLVVIEEIRRALDERFVAAQQEIAAAEKEKSEKEATAQALLDEQEKMMNSIVEESRKLQKEAEENMKLKDFLVEQGQIVDTLQGEMALICEDVSLLKRVVDERLSLSKLQRSTMSSLSSSLHSSLHRSGSSSGRTIETVESTDKRTVTEAASPVAKDLVENERTVSPVAKDVDDNERTVEVSDGNHNDKGIYKSQVSNEDGWEFLEDVQE
uniref:CUE domain-containing protein n=1 Tax=Arundo donax TaxID=35708 RepID=A0A0A9CT95_ARUDO